ncbi:hypothetical protein A1O3_00033 [Capronia epimyces CBS 606.96]|uniref:P-type ATPase A domain-containing protein n=1 Tax=Capronia epimyces CBS 606.96 TaxID=1182542 RepID=W9YP96_9EURO|nr:uncharacterized protein A1O3_00033 [Capronia epimyces CBS 606.96]EXJ91485.1 hypothetical protein A1O3_00033 [Capronia epimyces CBS 606.96]
MSLLTSCALQVGLLDSVIRAYRSSSASSSPWDSAAFDSLTLLATVLLGGRYAKALLSQHTFAATASLAALLPSEALVVAEDEGEGEGEGEVGAGVSAVRHIPPSMLRVGDVVLVHPNTAAPCDGDVVTGSSEMLEACLNGGTVPRPKRAGDPVFTGCVNLRQTLKIQVTRAGKDTWLEKALETTLSATRNKSSVQALSETAAEYFVLVVFSVMLAACSLEAYYHFTDMSSVLHRACLILLSACPCTLGLSVPSCIMVATGVAARHGVLMSPRPSCLQAATTLRMIMLDKTGTLTRGNVKVKEHHMSSTVPPALHPLIFKVIFQAEIGSQHPIATALRQYCAMLCAEDHAAGLRSQVHSVHTHHGLGVSALVNLPPQPDPATIRIGSLRYMQWSHCTPAPDLEYCIEREPGPSPSPVGAFSPGSVYIALDSTVICTIQLTDPLEPSASRFVSTAHSLALSVGILTGDTLSSVVPVAASLSIPRSRVWASCLPHDKARIISGLKERYSSPKGCVAMVGDNMNDIPALSAADLSIAVATDAFQLPDGVADALILNSPSSPSVSHTIQGSRQEHDDHSSSLPRVLFIISLLARTSHIIQQNVLWALCYNTVVLFLSSGLGRLIGLTWDMSPLHAALGMSLSSLAVLANSLRLEGEDMWPLQRSRGPGKSGVDLMRG